MSRPVALLVHRRAGGGRAARALPDVLAELGRLGLQVKARETKSLEHARELAVAAAAAGAMVVPFGGDGLIGGVADALRGHPDALMGLLPGGRGNDFARTCGIPSDPVVACRILRDGMARPVDLGEVGGRAFAGIASVGIDSEANRIANEAPSALGGAAYVYGALRALVSFKPVSFRLELDRRRYDLPRGWTVAAANSKAYGGGMLLAPDASLDDGMLDVVLVSPATRLRFLRGLPKVFRGAHLNLPGITVERAREVSIEADRPLTVFADGDPIAELPATVRVLPGALRMMLPA